MTERGKGGNIESRTGTEVDRVNGEMGEEGRCGGG